MANLDAATIAAVLQKQGMPNTTENLNRIAQFAAVHPDLLAKYLGQGTDVAAMQGAGTADAIDNSIAAVENRGQLAGPNPYSSTVDEKTGMSNIGPGLVRTPEPTGRGNGAVRAGGASGQNAVVEPSMVGQGPAAASSAPVNPLTTDSGNVVNQPSLIEQIALSIGGPVAKMLVDRARQNVLRGLPANAPAPTETMETLPRHGAEPQQRQAAGRGAGAGGVNQPNTTRTPVPTTPSTPATNNPTRGSPAVPLADPDAVPRTGPPASGRTSTQTPADIERMKAEVAAERAGAADLQDQIKKTTKAKPRVRVPGKP